MSIKHISFDDSASVAFGSITASYTNLLTMSDDADIILVFNTCNTAIQLSIPAGFTNTRPPTLQSKNIRFPAGSSVAIDGRSNSKRIAKGIIQVRYVTAPASGEVTVTVIR